MSDGTGRIWKRGNVWWIDYGFRGDRHRESSGSTRKKDAVALLRQRMEEMGRGGPRVHEEDVTFEDLAKLIETDYEVEGRRSLPNLRTALGHLRERFGGWRAVDIRKDHLTAYVLDKQKAGYANGTIRRHLACLKCAYYLAVDAERLSRVPPFPTVKVNNVRSNFLTMADVEAICAELDDDLAPVVRFAALTGWRKGEIIALKDKPGLQWRQVDWEARTVRLDPGTTKNGDGRVFPFGALPPLEAVLRQQRQRTDILEREQGRIIPPVFHRAGEPIRCMRKAWNKAAKAAGLEGAWFHDLRRTAVRNLERAHVSRSVATKLTGHRTEDIYRRYAITDSVVLQEGVEKLARLHEGGDAREGRTAVPLRKAQGG